MGNLYMGLEQQRTIEQVITFLIESKKYELVQPILDLMRMSENWYGRLDEMRQQHPAPLKGEPNDPTE